MSHQGNIMIVSELGDIMFTTTRWGGAESAFIAQEELKAALAESGDEWYQYRLLTGNLSHHPSIDRPITAIGNSDTPTVIIDFRLGIVGWRDELSHDIYIKWTFEEYLKLDLLNLDARIEAFCQ